MVQGKTKGMTNKTATGRHAQKAAKNMKKGLRAIPPKKTILVKQASAHQNLSAKINRSIEQQMVAAASSGKLTIMKNTLPEGGAPKSKNIPKKS